MYFYIIDKVPVQRQRNIDNTKDISSENLNQAVSTLGAFLSVRDFTYRVANDLEVRMIIISIRVKVFFNILCSTFNLYFYNFNLSLI